MSPKVIAALVLCALPATSARAQNYAEIDSQIAHFVKEGNKSSWRPSRVFTGCPNLTGEQQYGFRQLGSMHLSLERENDLARSWTIPLRDCKHPQLERWFLDRFDAAIQRGDWKLMMDIRTALDVADSPGIRSYLWNLATDTTVPGELRNTAGNMYFGRLPARERVAEYLRAFKQRGLPYNIAWGVAGALMRDGYAKDLMSGMAAEVRVNPALAYQPAFEQIVQTAHDHADQNARHSLAAALERGLLLAPGRVTNTQRAYMEGMIRHLRTVPEK